MMKGKIFMTIIMGAVVAAQTHQSHDLAYSTSSTVLQHTNAPVQDVAVHHGQHEDHHAHPGVYRHGQTIHHGHPVGHNYGHHEAIHHKHHVEFHHGRHFGHHTEQHGHNDQHGHASSLPSSQNLKLQHEGQLTKHVEHHGHPNYEFAHKVKNSHTHEHKYQHEARDGDVIKGVYKQYQPDGTVRIVQYYTDKKGGFNANEKNPGHAEQIVGKNHYH